MVSQESILIHFWKEKRENGSMLIKNVFQTLLCVKYFTSLLFVYSTINVSNLTKQMKSQQFNNQVLNNKCHTGLSLNCSIIK